MTEVTRIDLAPGGGPAGRSSREEPPTVSRAEITAAEAQEQVDKEVRVGLAGLR